MITTPLYRPEEVDAAMKTNKVIKSTSPNIKGGTIAKENVLDILERRDYKALSELVEAEPRDALRCMLAIAKDGQLDIEEEHGRKAWAAALDTPGVSGDLRRKAVNQLAKIYRGRLSGSLESAADYIMSCVGMFLYSGDINKGFEYSDRTKNYFTRKRRQKIEEKICGGTGA